MRPLKCPNCGAPVELTEGQDQLTCPFCGAAFLAEKGSSARSIRIDARGVGEGLRHLARGVVWVGVGLTVLGIGAAVLLLRTPWRAPRSMAPAVRVNPVAPKKALALEDLAKLDKSSEFEVEVAPPPGGFAALGLSQPEPRAIQVAAFEIATAVLLIVAPIGGALVALVLLVVFTVLIVRLLRAGTTAPCRCFGGIRSHPLAWTDVARNVALGALAIARGILCPVLPRPSSGPSSPAFSPSPSSSPRSEPPS